jgi:hypothetical protein
MEACESYGGRPGYRLKRSSGHGDCAPQWVHRTDLSGSGIAGDSDSFFAHAIGPYRYLRYDEWDHAAEGVRYRREYVPKTELKRVRRWVRAYRADGALAAAIRRTLSCRVTGVGRVGIDERIVRPAARLRRGYAGI